MSAVLMLPLYRPDVPSYLMSTFGQIQLADVYDTGQEFNVDIFIGRDSY